MSVHESSDGDETTTSGGVSPLSPADVVTRVADLLEFARSDSYVHALCDRCYPSLQMGTVGFGLMVTACGSVMMFDPEESGVITRNRCPRCVELFAELPACPNCGSRLDQ